MTAKLLPTTVLSIVACVPLASVVHAKGPAKAPAPKPLPTYEEVVNTYADGVPLCRTNSEIVGGDDQALQLEGGTIPASESGEPRYQCYGTKLTVRKKVTLKGKTYRPGAKLTVDQNLYWIEVSGWQESKDGEATAKDGPDPLKAPSDVAGPPASANRSPSGLASRVVREGSGIVHPQPWDHVKIHFTSWTTDGQMVETTTAGSPTSFRLQDGIPGWTEGVQWMVVGEVRRFWIPAKLAYGEKPRAGEPKGTVVFDVELLEIHPGKRPIEAPRDVAAPPKNATRTVTGLAYVRLAKGQGTRRPAPTDRVKVHYSGWTTDGKLFDSSVARGEPTAFRLDGVIKGWTEGVQLMVVGDTMRFWIPGKLAYGDSPRPGVPAGMLVFDIELLEISSDD